MWRIANFPPWKEEWDRLLKYVDVIKMHGRESVNRLFETMNIISRYKQGKEILFPEYEEHIKLNNFAQKRIDVWRETIKTCKFDCWDCNVCDKIVSANTKLNLTSATKKALASARAGDSKLSKTVLDIPGLTSPKVKNFINKLCEMPEAKYLELGVFQGSIFASALEGNTIFATAVDNWSGNLPARPDVDIGVVNTDNHFAFTNNVKDLIGKNKVQVVNGDMWNLELKKLSYKHNILFYDGPHDEESHYKVLHKYLPVLDNQFVLVIDDWNWPNVSLPTKKAIKDLNLKVLYEEEINCKVEDVNDFWNGLGIYVLEKR